MIPAIAIRNWQHVTHLDNIIMHQYHPGNGYCCIRGFGYIMAAMMDELFIAITSNKWQFILVGNDFEKNEGWYYVMRREDAW